MKPMIIKKLIAKIYFGLARIAYAAKSNNKSIDGNYIAKQPVVLRGNGKIVFGEGVKFGVVNSPLFYNTYTYLEPRNEESNIVFGNNININNSFSAVAEKSITIKDNVLIGYNCSISDSNFHDLDPTNRNQTDPNPESVIISKNVFIGNNVVILKGVEIGENSVVATNAIVTKSFPNNVIIGGSPAKVIGKIDY
jgi:maltose O-acetyltransferase